MEYLKNFPTKFPIFSFDEHKFSFSRIVVCARTDEQTGRAIVIETEELQNYLHNLKMSLGNHVCWNRLSRFRS